MNTDRLYIRRFAAEDWEQIHKYLSDERVVKFEPYDPMTEEQCRAAAGHFASSSDFWAVCLPDKTLIGQVYFAEKEQQNWEIGFVFNHGYQGKGYATEAVFALLEEAFKQKGAHRVYAECNPENERSWKLLERVGFRREGHLLQNVWFKRDGTGSPMWQDTYIYGQLANETE